MYFLYFIVSFWLLFISIEQDANFTVLIVIYIEQDANFT